MAAPSADRINARAAKDRAFLKRALKNPGLRAKLDPKYLSGSQKQQRTLNTRLNAPITPGSSTTERDLAHAAQAATTVQFGPQESALGQQLGVAQQTQRDTGSFYDQYLANLAAHSQNVQAFQAGAQQALAGTAQGITGLAGQDATQLQAMANQQAGQQGVAPAGDLTGLQNQALTARQNLMGSFQALQGLQGANANTYADTQANVVAPGQKLSALAQAAGRTRDVGQKITDLKTQEGAFNEQFRDTRRQDEFKNVLAQQTLTGNQTIAATNAAANTTRATTSATNSSPAGKAAVTTATEEAKNAAKLGISVHQYRLLGPSERQRRLKDLKATTAGSSSDTRYTSGPFAGMLKSDVNALSNKDAQAKVDAYNKKNPQGGKGPDWKPSADQSTGRSQSVSLRDYAVKAKQGQAFVVGHGTMPRMNRQQAAAKIKESVAAPADPILLTAALDAAYDGRLSRATVRALITAGYKPSLIASALHVGTGPTPRPNTSTTRPGSGNANARQ